jgi:hypothetical protein
MKTSLMLERKKSSKKPRRSGRSVTSRPMRGQRALSQRGATGRGRTGQFGVDARVVSLREAVFAFNLFPRRELVRVGDALILVARCTRFHGPRHQPPANQSAENNSRFTITGPA